MGCQSTKETCDAVYSPRPLSLNIISKSQLDPNDIQFVIPSTGILEPKDNPKQINYYSAAYVVHMRISRLQQVIDDLKKNGFINDFFRSLLVQKANNQFSIGLYEQAIETLSQAVQICDKNGLNRSISYIGMYNNIGVCYGKLKKKKAARRKLIEALNLYFQTKQTLYHHMLNVLLSNLALYLKKKKKESKESNLSNTRQQSREKIKQVKENPQKKEIILEKPKTEQVVNQEANKPKKEKSVNPKLNQELLKQLGLEEFIHGQYDSLKIFHALLKFAKQQHAQKDILAAKIYHNIANQIGISGDYKLSKIYFQKAETLKLLLFGENNYEVATSKIGLANCNFKLGNYKDGLKLYESAINIIQALGLDTHESYAATIEKFLIRNIEYMLKSQQGKKTSQLETYLALTLIQKCKSKEIGSCKQLLLKLADFKKKSALN